MKKTILSIATLLATSSTLFAQSGGTESGDGMMTEGAHYITLGYGFPSITRTFFKPLNDLGGTTTVSGFGPLHIKYAYGFAHGWSIGLNCNLDNARFNIDNQGGFNCTGAAFNLRANKSLIQNDKFALYTGVGFGYHRYFLNSNYTGGNLNTAAEIETLETTLNSVVPVSFEGTVGGMFFITPNIGLYAEGGIAKSIVQLGIVFRQGGFDN
jgi:hypothetical protein